MRKKTQARRDDILQAAGIAFRERGFAGTTMAAVSERMGGSKATLYRYFKSKEVLFIAAMLNAVHAQANEVFDSLSPSVRRSAGLMDEVVLRGRLHIDAEIFVGI
jgi:AcrR family transcriptional regulator